MRPPPRQAISRDLLREHYAQPRERGVDAVRRRVAHALSAAERDRAAWAQRFLALQRAGFMPAGRIAAHAGVPGPAMMISCFVQPLDDCVWQPGDTAPSIYGALAETAATLRLGGGIGLDFSPIRPRGAHVANAEPALGPVSVLHLFEASAAALEPAGGRRGAQIGVLRCDHPDVVAFAQAKAAGGLPHFDLSVAVTDAFMAALQADTTLPLLHAAMPGAAQRSAGAARRGDGLWVYAQPPARVVWEHIVRGAHGQGEPGLLFVDRVNADDNLAYRETLAATNPCGEVPLPAYGSCCLGSFDLTRWVLRPFEADARLDLAGLAGWVPAAVRLLDNVLELSDWPLPRQRAEALATRRIGIGFTGLGDALAMLGQRYGGRAACTTAASVARCLRDAAYTAAVALAQERGAFTSFDAEGVLRRGSFASRLPERLQRAIRRHGLRHSHLLAVAPAGSISLAFADNVSSGIEPPFAWRCERRRWRDGNPARYTVEDAAWRLFRTLHGTRTPLPPAFMTAAELSPQEHLAMVAAVAPYIDGGIAKTVNLPADCRPETVSALLHRAWKRRLKGITVYRPNPVLGAVLQAPACTARR